MTERSNRQAPGYSRGVYGLTLEREDTEDAFVDAVEWLALGEAVLSLQPQGVLPESE